MQKLLNINALSTQNIRDEFEKKGEIPNVLDIDLISEKYPVVHQWKEGKLREAFVQDLYISVNTKTMGRFDVLYTQRGSTLKHTSMHSLITKVILFDGKKAGISIDVDEAEGGVQLKQDEVYYIRVYCATDQGDVVFSYRPVVNTLSTKLVLFEAVRPKERRLIRHFTAEWALEIFQLSRGGDV